MEIELLKDIVVVFALSVAVLLIFHRIKAPTIVGFLLTGILAGPQGLGLIQASDQVSDLAEIWRRLALVHRLGIEVSLRDLMKLKKYVLVGGSLQVFAHNSCRIFHPLCPGRAKWRGNVAWISYFT